MSRLMSKDVEHDQVSLILQLLLYYAKNYEGALHLSKIGVLECLLNSNILL